MAPHTLTLIATCLRLAQSAVSAGGAWFFAETGRKYTHYVPGPPAASAADDPAANRGTRANPGLPRDSGRAEVLDARNPPS